MRGKTVLILILVAVLAVLIVYPRLAKTGEAVTVSAVVADPDNYLGKLLTRGRVVEVDGPILYLADEGGCCEIPVAVPITGAQQQELGMNLLYSGTLPARGDWVEAAGVLKRQEGKYMFEIEKITRDGKVIINKL